MGYKLGNLFLCEKKNVLFMCKITSYGECMNKLLENQTIELQDLNFKVMLVPSQAIKTILFFNTCSKNGLSLIYMNIMLSNEFVETLWGDSLIILKILLERKIIDLFVSSATQGT